MKFESEIFDPTYTQKFWKQICLEVLEEALDNKFPFSKIPKGSTKEDLIKKLALGIYENSPLNIEKNIS